ncbi:MAG: radical SAM family heme chaperone HemW [Clostridia bacterium]|nr:radical SAM family heme chaperone HemW [Clostridia bacterium]
MTTMIDNNFKNEKAPRNLGLYIHIPFCRTKCLYCDFCSFVSRDEQQREAYVGALLREIEARGTKDYSVDTVYFGGGTPSLLSAEQIGRILGEIKESFNVSPDAEITLECNPMTVSDGDKYFKELRALGVNRLSLGVQSAVDGELKLIGRRHSFEDAKATFLAARGAGFENISVDLMLGIPSQTLDSLRASANQVIKLAADHISIYSLQLEEGTPLYRMRERYSLADDDTAADMYELVVKMMKDAGYRHYEISNFARGGRESKHNCKYWRLDEYLGLGLAAHSDFGGKRLENTRDMERYLGGEWLEAASDISNSEREFEFLMLGFRTADGISKSEFLARFGVGFDEKYGEKMEKFKKMGYFCEKGDALALTESGFEVSNAILTEILDFDY